jgi:YNFM family putative membrane transporter
MTPSSDLKLPAIAAVATAVAVATIYTTQPIFAEIAAYFTVSTVQARMSFFVATLAYALSFFAFGPLSDRLPAKRLASVGGVALALFTACAPFVGSFTWFVVVLALAGVAAAAVPAALFALMARIAPPGSVGTYFGLMIAASVGGITLGRTLGGVVAGWAGWQQAFVIMAVLNLASVLLLQALPGSAAQDDGPSLRLREVYANAVAMYADARVVRLLAVGALLFFGYLGTVTFLTFRLAGQPFQFSSETIGYISLAGLIALVGAPAAGQLINRWGARAVALAGLGVCASGVATLGLAQTALAITVGLLLVFLGVFSCQPAVMVLLSKAVGPQRRGTASSAYLLACLGAGSLSSFALGPVWTSLGWTGIIAAALGCLAMAAVLAIRLRPASHVQVAASVGRHRAHA